MKFLTDWTARQGITISPSVKVQFDPHKGYHVVAVQSIPVGSLLMSVPFATCSLLHSKRANYSPVEKALAPLKLPGLYIQASQLLVLLFGGGDQLGEHGKIIKALNLESITFSSDSSQSAKILLKGTTLDDGGGALPVSDRFKEIWPRLSQSLVDMKESKALELFSFCCKLVLSRCVETDGSDMSECASGPQFVPVIDFFNHSANPQAQIEQKSVKGGGSFVCHSVSAIASGDEVFISYGEKSDAELYRQYGFVLRPQVLTSAEQALLSQQKHLFDQQTFNLLSEDSLFASVFSTYLNPHNTVFLSAALVESAVLSIFECDFTIPLNESFSREKTRSVKASQYRSAQTLCKSSGLYFEGGGFTCLAGNVSYDLILVVEVLLRSLLFPSTAPFIPDEASSCPSIEKASKSSKKRKLTKDNDDNDDKDNDKKGEERVKRLVSWDILDKENISKSVWLSLFLIFAAKRNEVKRLRNYTTKGKNQGAREGVDEFRSQYFSLTDVYLDHQKAKSNIDADVINCQWIAMGEEEILLKFMTSINRNLGLGLDRSVYTGLLHSC